MPTEEELNRDDNKKYYNTKRLRVYKAFALYFFNPEKFQHKYSEKTSFYLICNKKSRKKTKKLSEKIIDMLGDYYTF